MYAPMTCTCRVHRAHSSQRNRVALITSFFCVWRCSSYACGREWNKKKLATKWSVFKIFSRILLWNWFHCRFVRMKVFPLCLNDRQTDRWIEIEEKNKLWSAWLEMLNFIIVNEMVIRIRIVLCVGIRYQLRDVCTVQYGNHRKLE